MSNNKNADLLRQVKDEEWRPIAGYEDFYEVSNMGRFHIKPSKRMPSGKIIVGYPDNKGYMVVGLSKSGVRKTKKVHRLVAEAFLSNNAAKPDVNHINGDKSDNRIDNLEWVTHDENMRHRAEKLNVVGCNRKLSRIDVFFILERKEIGSKKIAKILGIESSVIRSIRRGCAYKDFVSEFNKSNKN